MGNGLDLNVLKRLFDELYGILPKILWTLLFLLLSWVVYKVVVILVKSALKLTRIDKLSAKINEVEFLKNSSFKIDLVKVVLAFVKWFVILILIIVGSDMLGLTVVSTEASRLIAYLPQFFSGLAILVIGVIVATFLKNTVQGMLKSFDLSGSKSIGLLVFYVVVIIAGITALNQIGINTDIITNNLLIVLGAFLAALTIALGLGSRDIIYRLILGFYTRKNFEIGMRVRIDGVEGVIVMIDNISFVVATGEKKIVYPIKSVSNRKVEILEGDDV
ncbi:mechanosensitive ion channel family protein [Sinomicrobium weinanense]|uniref:Mechanosensitive ion channel n=1 Tax=Sinomicrobium weinanense TaxID=2842200 RepID=A0A926JUG0_9FLAO|nr:mechanosensitive ion channel [Sinomicrobium weinanense]MBC9797534.1 mechanosensitive ion channel [Sinomicrobium weinanense]MBU3122393.1 mechanosensitive ion channel [Sinomicrobium weinanense]